MTTKPKALFGSKTIVFNLIVSIAAVVAYFYPPANEFIQSNSLLILAGIGAANVVLRRVTKESYAFFPLLILCFCSVAFISCVPASYQIDLTTYEDQIKTNPSAVVVAPEHVTEIGGIQISGGAKIITDQGELDISENGIDGTVVVDLRSQK
jgi:hypothetical protein